ncbi:hypothetical protein DL766_002514 [Monosporascus sp. MC13-8B]|uniref:Uncharacterized protein n=1 Tax=Monosporascus cannonballus TaxID=155416 RepID=A0ABY0HJK7_9PEZI|nr:hypothetical protein DL762_001369 [Monosporascus cannonballus]RYP01018.1 hypothetical protein DL763_000439 [Monosporascus cannonballus]RYP35338.1 hypothetical protein DL766_002514 [Monosporascus sp. MC13-8B]
MQHATKPQAAEESKIEASPPEDKPPAEPGKVQKHPSSPRNAEARLLASLAPGLNPIAEPSAPESHVQVIEQIAIILQDVGRRINSVSDGGNTTVIYGNDNDEGRPAERDILQEGCDRIVNVVQNAFHGCVQPEQGTVAAADDGLPNANPIPPSNEAPTAAQEPPPGEARRSSTKPALKAALRLIRETLRLRGEVLREDEHGDHRESAPDAAQASIAYAEAHPQLSEKVAATLEKEKAKEERKRLKLEKERVRRETKLAKKEAKTLEKEEKDREREEKAREKLERKEERRARRKETRKEMFKHYREKHGSAADDEAAGPSRSAPSPLLRKKPAVVDLIFLRELVTISRQHTSG